MSTDEYSDCFNRFNGFNCAELCVEGVEGAGGIFKVEEQVTFLPTGLPVTLRTLSCVYDIARNMTLRCQPVALHLSVYRCHRCVVYEYRIYQRDYDYVGFVTADGSKRESQCTSTSGINDDRNRNRIIEEKYEDY
jgi:hypothetical protein